MAQVFRPGVLLVAKIALLGVAAAMAAGVVTIYKSLEGPVHVGDAPRQPIPFSHQHHAGDDGIDCRYCHTTVEKDRFAGLPSTETCLTCHSQLFTDAAVLQPLHESARTGKPVTWTRVHDLPGFVYFDHSIHINKGIACMQCHGAVDHMPLTRRVASLEMQWCLECHRHPVLREAAQTALLSERRRTDCSTCHR